MDAGSQAIASGKVEGRDDEGRNTDSDENDVEHGS
jgi:hypothetical protein